MKWLFGTQCQAGIWDGIKIAPRGVFITISYGEGMKMDIIMGMFYEEVIEMSQTNRLIVL
jgi:hypothetical protein